jgi:hypothetical protein
LVKELWSDNLSGSTWKSPGSTGKRATSTRYSGRFFVTNLNIPTTFDPSNALTLSRNGQADRVYALSIGSTYLIASNIVSAFHIGANRHEIPKIPDRFATWLELGVNAPYNPGAEPRFASDLAAAGRDVMRTSMLCSPSRGDPRWAIEEPGLPKQKRAKPSTSPSASNSCATVPQVVQLDLLANGIYVLRQGSKATTRPIEPTRFAPTSVKNPAFAPISKNTIPGPSDRTNASWMGSSY